ncbi:nicotinamide riboside transporter PnuC [Bacillus salipaludis]|uniref:nicotinamide riboside transporter PnuC n=1 Tax=Bacillus salipaludis TaxID=2547811 RepID=UPI002E1C1FE9|nr:nicotinamide riboside transporter PnuC [Bacillus salipaludis]
MKNNLINYFILVIFVAVAYFKDSTFIEVLASFFGLVCVYLAAKENIWNYPIGIVNIVLLLLIFYNAKLFADMMLQGMFLVFSLYGWFFWLRNRGEKLVCQTTKLTLDGWVLIIFIIPILSYGWGYLLNKYTDASAPFLDSFIATTSLVAQVLFSTKKFENWYLWILVDILSVGLYVYKGLYTISFTYFVFLIICIVGVFEWRKHYY